MLSAEYCTSESRSVPEDVAKRAAMLLMEEMFRSEMETGFKKVFERMADNYQIINIFCSKEPS